MRLARLRELDQWVVMFLEPTNHCDDAIRAFIESGCAIVGTGMDRRKTRRRRRRCVLAVVRNPVVLRLHVSECIMLHPASS